MGMTAIEEESSPPRIEGGPRGRVGHLPVQPSGARRAPTAADEAPDPSYDANDDPTMTAVRRTNDVSSDDTDGADGPAGASHGHGHVDDGGGPGPPVKARGRRGKHIGLEKAPSGQ
ncbi:hypothetical protein THAOC_28636 [Thalassiosira oceanica]|uniref:Uncharacterized protein n=1 Tax=Thalassiosira oceanica TaxID=159749 RepID=K0REJ3_THAOC|nr:hypothetical protein THAOC_28636 [Thalassiosira oceanica]|eukprot:EJK52128.1 hypothetical protein THAOC_28636 [Thalassiosira oceanica]